MSTTQTPVANDWRELALCAQTDPEAFFPERNSPGKGAKKICDRCDVKADCLADALAMNERFGVRGGLTPAERRKLKRRHA